MPRLADHEKNRERFRNEPNRGGHSKGTSSRIETGILVPGMVVNQDCLFVAVDIGNSFMKFGLFDAAVSGDGLPGPLSLCVETTSAFFDLTDWLQRHQARSRRLSWIVSSVNGDRTVSLRNWLKRNRSLDAVREVALSDIPMTIRYDRPAELGIDRALAAYGARTLLKTGGPFMVVDIGTAATIDLVDDAGDFAGGAILPGPRMAAQALYEKTAKLPRTEPVPAETSYPASNTEDAINLGIGYGLAGAIFSFYVQTRHHMKAKGVTVDFPILLTGRGGNLVERQLEAVMDAVRDLFGHGLPPHPHTITCTDLVLRTLAFISKNISTKTNLPQPSNGTITHPVQ